MSTNGLMLLDPEAAATLDVDTNAQTLNSAAVVVDEADGLKATLLAKMAEKFREVAIAEATLAKGLLAEAVQAVVNVLHLPNKPKYATIAGLIVKAMGREAYSLTQVKYPDETIQDKIGSQNIYRQYATPFVALARWEAGLWTKPELAHQERNPGLKKQIVYKNEVFDSPINALRGGVPWSTCYRLFRNCISPGWSDLSTLDTAKTEKIARDWAKDIKKPKIKITMLDHAEDGTPRRGHVPVKGHGALTTGTIIGLLENARLTQGQVDRIMAALVLVQPATTPTTV